MVSGTIGDGHLGLLAVRGEIPDPDGFLARRYRLPTPRLDLRGVLLASASAAADVSDGLIADAGHIAEASGVGLRIELDHMPLSPAAAAWLDRQADRSAGLVRLATGGDDYEIVCTGPQPLSGFTQIGEVVERTGVQVLSDGQPLDVGAGGWRHG
jgi:thiamine-monophosphate kinase